MKSVGLSDEVYSQLLLTKHNFERQEGRVVSYDEVIRKLIFNNNGNKDYQKVEKKV